MSSLQGLKAAAFLALAALVALTPLSGQSTASGTISGLVTDQSQAVIEGAEIRLTDVKTGIATTTTTNNAGRYVFINVNPGTYTVTITKQGFVTQKIVNQQVEIGRVLTLDLTLTVGGTTTTVEVQAAAGAELQTMNATIGNTIRGDALILLPNTSRDVSSLFTISVGVTPGGNVAGAVSDQNSFQLDGGNNTSDMDGNQTVYTPSFASNGAPTGVIPTPVESIEEFKLSATNHTADFNGAAGAQVQLVTKRGSNQIHGSAYDYYLASNIWAANTWKNNHTPSPGLGYTPLPKTHYNRFGFTLGGPVIKKEILGGRTYLFGMYEGYRFPNATIFERATPSPLLRLGVVQLPDASGVYQKYNLNTSPVTYQGQTINPAVCGSNLACDPRNLGMNALVSKIWNTQMPLPNDPQYGDTFNSQGYLTTVALPQKSNFLVGRLDHDFGSKNRFYSSYRYFYFSQATANQVDIGGVLPGAKFGQATAYAPRPQQPWFYVASLNTTLTPTMTNNFNFSYLRNFWQWSTAAAPPQLPGLGGALGIGADAQLTSLIPYNVNAQQARQRFWNGHDYTYRDDVSWLKGKHLIQFGGEYQRNVDGHQRNDNGVGIMSSFVYQMNDGAGVANTTYVPAGLPAAQLSNWRSFYNQVLGIVTQPQVMYTRAGQNLALQPVGTDLFTNVIIPSFNVYFSDSWRIKPNLTITYGTGYQVEKPPYETEGKQVILVDTAGKPVDFEEYFNKRFQTGVAGGVYNPSLGFATIKNVNGDNTYPYKPFYGGISPRVAVAWTPKFQTGILNKIFGDNKTVIRGGYSRLYGRLNGVGNVLIPLLGTGLAQAVSCIGPRRDGTCPNIVGGVDPTNAFRIGTDGLTAPLPAVSNTLSQPYYPGLGGNAAAADGTVLDPATKPNHSDQFNFTIQREIKRNVIMEVGYIGRRIRDEFQQVNLNAVPWMTTVNGQSFAAAFANVYQALANGSAVPNQPFFEGALGGANSPFCASAGSCTAAVVATNRTNITSTQVYTLWGNLDRANGWTLGRTLLSSSPSQATAIFVNRSNGYGNYNAAFLSLTLRDWHGLTARSNLTFSRSLGTGAVVQATSSFTAINPWDLKSMYGRQGFDIPWVYNLGTYYQPKFLEGFRGPLKYIAGGWSIAPLFTAQSGLPLRVSIGSNCQSFGEVNCSSGSTYENAVQITPFSGGNSLNSNVTTTGAVARSGNAALGGSGLNMFSDPTAVYNGFRRLVLGLDTSGGGFGVARGFPVWNLDLSIVKDIKILERVKTQFSFQFNNVLNHFQPADPTLNIDTPQTFGVVTTQLGSIPARQVQFGLRIAF